MGASSRTYLSPPFSKGEKNEIVLNRLYEHVMIKAVNLQKAIRQTTLRLKLLTW